MRFLPVATYEQVAAFVPEDTATHTASPLVNAVAEVLYSTKLIECKDIAANLHVDERKLSNALSLELGMTLKDLVSRYRMDQVLDFIAEHPDYTPEQLAEAIGYASRDGIARFLYAKLGMTPAGRKSHRCKDHTVELVSKIRALRRMNLTHEEFIKAIKELR